MRFEVRGTCVASGHRSVLSSRSPVFARMFANDTLEKETGVVKIDDVTGDVSRNFFASVVLACMIISP